MASETQHILGYGVSLRPESEKHFNRMMLFAGILVFAHLLDIRPAVVEQLSVKIKIADPSIVYGALAFVLYDALYKALTTSVIGTAFFRIDANRRLLRSLIVSTRRNDRKASFKRVKSIARFWFNVYYAVMLPYALVILLLVLIALVVGAVDIIDLLSYLYNTSKQLAFLREFFV